MTDLLQGKKGVWVARQVSSEALAESLQSALLAIHPEERFAHPWADSFRLKNAIPAYERAIDAALGMTPS